MLICASQLLLLMIPLLTSSVQLLWSPSKSFPNSSLGIYGVRLCAECERQWVVQSVTNSEYLNVKLLLTIHVMQWVLHGLRCRNVCVCIPWNGDIQFSAYCQASTSCLEYCKYSCFIAFCVSFLESFRLKSQFALGSVGVCVVYSWLLHVFVSITQLIVQWPDMYGRHMCMVVCQTPD